MTHEEKVAFFLDDLECRGKRRSMGAPPLWRLAWRLGLRVPPPQFISIVPLALFFVPFIELGLAAVMWLVTRLFYDEQALWVASLWLAAGPLCGGLMAGAVRYRAAKLRLPPWSEYPAKVRSLRAGAENAGPS